MCSVKILHLADVHIGRKYINLSSEKASMRFSETLITLEDTLNRFKDAKLVLMAGDIFEEDCPDSAVYFVCNLFKKHSDKHFLISCGNHDFYECKPIKTLIQHLPENAYVFSDTIEKLTFDDIKVNVYGVSFSAPSSYTSLLNGFSVLQSEYINIMVMHADVFTDSKYNPVNKLEIAQSKLDYLALGHIHSFSDFLNSGDVTYAYPGVLEPGGFDEAESCGVIYGDVFKGHSSLDFYEVSKRKYHTNSIDISKLHSNEEVVTSIRELVDEKDFYKITLKGFRNNFIPDTKLYANMIYAFYIEFCDETENKEDIFDYVNEFSLRGKTANALLKLKDSADADVFDIACDIITNLMCKG